MLQNHHNAQSVKIHVTEVSCVHPGEYDGTKERGGDLSEGAKERQRERARERRRSYE